MGLAVGKRVRKVLNLVCDGGVGKEGEAAVSLKIEIINKVFG